MKWIDRLFEQHKAARRLMLFWAAGLITYATIKMFTEIGAITGPSVTAYGIVTGLLATVIGMYQWSRSRDDEMDSRR